MSSVRDLHNQAMQLMHQADRLRDIGQDAKKLYAQACDYEEQAAQIVSSSEDNEPSRSILYLSAASLAWCGKELMRAERLVATGLQGSPSQKTRKDLYKLLDDIRYGLSVAEPVVELDEAALDMRLYGDRVRWGSAPLKAVFDRLDNLSRLFFRTYQRLCSQPYQDGRKKSTFVTPYSINVAISAPASFGVTMKLTREPGESLPLIDISAQKIFDDVISGIELIDKGEVEILKEKISDESYLTNFITLAGEIAPDGQRINMVGLSTMNRSFAFKSARSSIKESYKRLKPIDVTPGEETISLKGYLDIADRKKGTLLFTDQNDNEYTAKVKEGLEDVARKYFGLLVEVEMERNRGKYLLSSISSIDDGD